MKYCVYSDGETSPYHVGIVDLDRGLVVPFDLGEADARNGILSLITASTMPRLLHDGAVPVGEVRLKAPIPRPRRNIFCVGKNYFEHAHEFAGSGFDSSAAAGAVPKAPIIFSKLPETVIADGAPIRIDTKVSTAIDYEAELAVIIGRGGRGISRASALDHVWGYTIVNDVTARDLQGKHSQWLLGKSQDGFCPMGPWAVSRDELDLGNAGIRCYVNGELRQSSNTSLLIFDVSLLIETISAGITLLPRDIIATGTPAGVGIGFNPPKNLVAGGRVRVAIDNIRTPQNPGF